jgi:hypothetical protein
MAWAAVRTTSPQYLARATHLIMSQGNAIGPQVFRDQDKPRYFPAFAVILASFVALVVVLISLRFYYTWQNSIKERKIAQDGTLADEEGIHGFEDITDRVSWRTPRSCRMYTDNWNLGKRQFPICLLKRYEFHGHRRVLGRSTHIQLKWLHNQLYIDHHMLSVPFSPPRLFRNSRYHCTRLPSRVKHLRSLA